MATISGATNEKVYNIPKWLGLNEHPDGDTRLKLGEASEMGNWKITRDGNLKRRPGTTTVAGCRSGYRVTISPIVTTILTCSSTDEIEVFEEVYADIIPGKIVTGNAINISNGVMRLTSDYSISGGVLTIPEGTVRVSNGILNFSATAEKMTPAVLASALAELAEGEYLYVTVDEITYALNGGCVSLRNGAYSVGGYRVTAEPLASDHPSVAGLWAGMYNGKHVLLAACDDAIYSLYDEDTDTFSPTVIGADIDTSKGVSFFSFGDCVYMLNGYDYYQLEAGSAFVPVVGYIPLVAIAISPLVVVNGVLTDGAESGTTTSEYVNRLSGKRRVWLSPNGTGTTFQMPETDLVSFDYVKDLKTDEIVDPTNYTVDLSTGRITFDAQFISDVGDVTNSHEVQYTAYSSGSETDVLYRGQVASNLYAELYSGATDTRIFLYGNGTNKTVYSGLNYYGATDATYFPDQYEAAVGDSGTPITSMIRHYGDLVCYKEDSCWSLKYDIVTLDTGDVVPGLYVTPVNKARGNLALGQVRLVDNNPVTCSGKELYRWVNSSYYTSSLSRDERQAQRISDRVQKSIRELDLSKACMWDDDDNQEFYISQGGITLVWNYATDTWYRYEGLDIACMCSFNGECYFGTSDGLVKKFTYEEKGDEGEPIDAKWVSGAMDFSSDYYRKYSSMLWIGLKPEEGTSVDVTVITDRKNTFREKIVSSEKAKISGQPFMAKTKIKAKKFAEESRKQKEAKEGKDFVASRKMFDESERLHPLQEEELIKVENINGKIVFIGAKDDVLWDTTKYIQRMNERI